MISEFKFNELAEKRYTVRSYKDTPVNDECVEYILKAAKLAPTAKNNQPQRIYVIKGEESLARLDKCTRCRYNAPMAFVIGYDKDICFTRTDLDKKSSGDIDASIVTTHMMLACADIGLGSTWVMAFDPFKLREEFNIEENVDLTAVLMVGYAAEDGVPSPRHTLYRDENEIISYK